MAPVPAAAWTDDVHEQLAGILAETLPAQLRTIVINNMQHFLDGVAEEPELFDEVTDNDKKATTATIRRTGVENFIFRMKRLIFFIEKKSEDRAIAYEIGRLARVAQDLLEPLPEDGEFSILEITGHRMFFIDDVSQARENFRFLTTTRRAMRSVPERLEDELEISMEKGAIIYSTYRNGRGYAQVEKDAQEMMNRSVNLVADTVTTILQNSAAPQGSPFDPTATLGLDRFRKKAETDGPTVDAPAPPAPPAGPAAPEKTDNNGSEKNNEDKENN